MGSDASNTYLIPAQGGIFLRILPSRFATTRPSPEIALGALQLSTPALLLNYALFLLPLFLSLGLVFAGLDGCLKEEGSQQCFLRPMGERQVMRG